MSAAVDPMIGRVFAGRYRIDARLGRGGFGAVYRATHLALDRPVALKVIHGGGHDDLTARFRREARLQAMLRHPVCVIVHDYGEDDGDPWLVQELIEGRELRAVLAAESRLDSARAVAITCRLLEGLGAAHAHGVIHRDIKPANIMLVRGPDGEDVRLLDFGIARAMTEEETCLTSPGAVIGTPRYIAPEQARGLPPEPASDLYSVGVVLHHMLAGAPPFPSLDMREAVIAHLTHDPPPLPDDVPPRLAAVIAQALAKHPEERPPSAAAMIDRLRAAMRAPVETDEAPPPATEPTPTERRRRPIARALLGISGALALLAVIGGRSEAPDVLPPVARDAGPLDPPAWDGAIPKPTTRATAPLTPDAEPTAPMPDAAPDVSTAPRPDPRPTRARPHPDPQRQRIARLQRTTTRALADCRCDEAERALESLRIISPNAHEPSHDAFIARCRLRLPGGCGQTSVQ